MPFLPLNVTDQPLPPPPLPATPEPHTSPLPFTLALTMRRLKVYFDVIRILHLSASRRAGADGAERRGSAVGVAMGVVGDGAGRGVGVRVGAVGLGG